MIPTAYERPINIAAQETYHTTSTGDTLLQGKPSGQHNHPNKWTAPKDGPTIKHLELMDDQPYHT